MMMDRERGGEKGREEGIHGKKWIHTWDEEREVTQYCKRSKIYVLKRERLRGERNYPY